MRLRWTVLSAYRWRCRLPTSIRQLLSLALSLSKKIVHRYSLVARRFRAWILSYGGFYLRGIHQITGPFSISFLEFSLRAVNYRKNSVVKQDYPKLQSCFCCRWPVKRSWNVNASFWSPWYAKRPKPWERAVVLHYSAIIVILWSE